MLRTVHFFTGLLQKVKYNRRVFGVGHDEVTWNQRRALRGSESRLV
jgi:hypothetical protein